MHQNTLGIKKLLVLWWRGGGPVRKQYRARGRIPRPVRPRADQSLTAIDPPGGRDARDRSKYSSIILKDKYILPVRAFTDAFTMILRLSFLN
jgi:hypothetical protein